jgi:hypothetical protein
MAEGWSISDYVLQAALQAWLSSLYPAGLWYVDLFMNDHSPQPGDVTADYTLPTWPGYTHQPITLGDFSRAATADHVAVSTYGGTLYYPVPEGSGTQTVYGYLLSDNFGNLIWSEAFSSTLSITFPGGVWITPVIRCSILPYTPVIGPRGRGRPRGKKARRADS